MVLCDLIEVRSPKWQSAIEGYVGGSRFNIVVDELIEGAAGELVRKLGWKTRHVKVVQGRLAKQDAERLPDIPNSIVTELIVSHPSAKAYLKANYGRVVKVKSMDELASTRRGVTKNGMGSGGYAMFQCGLLDDRLVFGQKARERARAALSEQCEAKENQKTALEDVFSGVKKLVLMAKKMTGGSIECHVQGMQHEAKKIERIEESLANLDLTSIEEIDNKLRGLKEQQKQEQEAFTTHTQKHAVITSEITQQEDSIEEQTGALVIFKVDVVNERQTMVELSQLDVDYPYEERMTALDAQATERIETGTKDDRFVRSGNYRKRRSEFINQIFNYNKVARKAEKIPISHEIHKSNDFTIEFFVLGMEMYAAVEQQLKNQEGIGLAEANSRLEEAQKDVQDIFTSDFCTMILGAIKEGERQLKKLSLELKGHTFGDDQFEFDSEWVPAYQKYHRFFKAVAEMKNMGEGDSLFTADLTEDQIETRDEIIELLTCEAGESTEKNIDLAKKKLMEITDYRNYKTYEIYKISPNGTNALSEYGTGSGGQLETPAYVVRSASVTSAFRIGVSRQSLKVLLIDESFSKCDESRAKQIIEYLAHSLGTQVIFIMPSKSAGPFFDVIDQKIVFSKIISKETSLGELKTIVHVDCQKFNQERVKKLWERHRSLVAQQTALDFDKNLAVGGGIG